MSRSRKKNPVYKESDLHQKSHKALKHIDRAKIKSGKFDDLTKIPHKATTEKWDLCDYRFWCENDSRVLRK